ncbi:SMI1/KNR4 family protein [Kitasatospora sp. NPDC058965]|uniref:SMI1/KNR4 family protein n=1 Tax=Kitasatospora sp. NPDC058965 TaxID=3346682 RepID=UPI00367CEA81
MHPSVARLAAIVPPHPGAGDAIDWAEARCKWGTHFPADYRDFVSVYGGGSINNSFFIGLPLEVAQGPRSPLTFEELNDDGYGLLDLAPEEDPALRGWISWAADCSASHAFWDTSDPDPDKWSTLVLERGGDWVDYDCGMVDFLIGFLTKEISPQPMGMFSPERPTFLNWREVRRLKAEGIDPWPYI